jgi:hypothetical protein
MILANSLKHLKIRKAPIIPNNIIISNSYSIKNDIITTELKERLKPRELKGQTWTKEEQELLVSKVSEYKNNWGSVHRLHFQYRTLGSIQSKYYSLKKIQLLNLLKKTKDNKGELPDSVEFNESELNLLKDLKSKNLSIYEIYMRHFSYRNPSLLLKHFTKIRGTPPLIQGTWSSNEIDLLFQAVNIHGRNWKEISAHVVTRNEVQCAMFWDYHINRLASNNWTKEDDANLMKFVEKYGTKSWVLIGKKFKPYKGAKHCKARYIQLKDVQDKETESSNVDKDEFNSDESEGDKVKNFTNCDAKIAVTGN